jgi:benzodiazapine receptor
MGFPSRDFAKLLAAILLCQAAGFVGSLFTFASIPTWYASLNKPWFNPPNWLFGPAWITLYTLMGISLFIVWRKGLNESTRLPLIVFGLQLFLNALWSILFFGLQMPLLAFIEIIALWAAIAFTIYKFYPISRKAAWLLVPYLAWVSFAALLNYSIWALNPLP